jgi:hypothetical protein
METPGASTTLSDLHRPTPLLWLSCERCQHHAPLVPSPSSAGPRRVERCVARARSLHRLRPQGRFHPTTGMERRDVGCYDQRSLESAVILVCPCREKPFAFY